MDPDSNNIRMGLILFCCHPPMITFIIAGKIKFFDVFVKTQWGWVVCCMWNIVVIGRYRIWCSAGCICFFPYIYVSTGEVWHTTLPSTRRASFKTRFSTIIKPPWVDSPANLPAAAGEPPRTQTTSVWVFQSISRRPLNCIGNTLCSQFHSPLFQCSRLRRSAFHNFE